MSVLVVRPGLLSSVQDLGRYGFQHLGIVPCGAMDSIAHCMANTLVGNDDECATLECTIAGPELAFEEEALVAFYGAAFQAKSGSGLPGNRPVLVKAGTTVNLGTAVRGSRAYLAIAGGFAVPPVLGSRSTYVPGAFGGLGGRALRAGDRLDTIDSLAALSAERFARLPQPVRWSAPELTLPPAGALTVRAMEGRHWQQFDDASRAAFFSHAWRVSPTSNRMGYRLEGPRLARKRNVDVLSEPTCLGTVQVPNDGTPIALMADHQTTGGYPKIAEIAGADLPGLAQLAPGGAVRFVPCTLEEAQRAEDEKLERLRSVRYSIRSQF
jgi:biotin-dependent carboxylase-like uncharacterized protein